MIERYLDYLSAIRRYSPRTIEIYRGVLEDYLAYLSQSGEADTATASGNRSHPRLRKREGPNDEGVGRGPAQQDVSGGRSMRRVYIQKDSRTSR